MARKARHPKYQPPEPRWDGHCIMRNGQDKVPMTKTEAERLGRQLGKAWYKCRGCKMYHLTSQEAS